MSKTIIKVENLSKRYRLQNSLWQYGALRDLLAAPFQRKKNKGITSSPNKSDFFWALRDISFSVRQGETLGIIGNNGAGKSTLLKILSRITRPSAGSAELQGRVGSLLEVGTGFHPELSGRENVFLNGAILGMKRREVEHKFDEIVSFAQVEAFLETPVKHYSSGMFMRLAFSVAAHLESDVLIVDEVLAVGDSDFQHKCLDKMQQIMNQGRTILFVSHNMSAITRLAQRAIALNQGQVVAEGDAQKVVNEYLNAGWGIAPEKIWERDAEDRPQNEIVKLEKVRVCNKKGETVGSVEMHQPVGVEVTYEVTAAGHYLIPNFHVFNQERLHLFALQDVATEWRKRARERGIYTTTAWLPGNFFNEGRIIVEVAISSHIPATRVHLRTGEIVSFEIIENPHANFTRGDFNGSLPGVVRPLAEWTTTIKS